MQKGFSPILIVVVLAIVALGGYLIFQSQNKQSTTSEQTTQTSPPTIDETANWKTYISTQLPNNSLKAYTIKYPNSWTVNNEKSPVSDKLTLSKDNYSITIYQAGMSGSGFIFEGTVPNGPYRDFIGKKYTEVTTDIGILRRVEDIEASKDPNTTTFAFCVMNGKDCVSTTSVGPINYNVPKNYDVGILNEMDKIISTLKEAAKQ